MMNFLIDYILLFLLIIFFDSIFLTLMSNHFNSQVALIQGQGIELRNIGVVLFYLSFTLGIYYFGIIKKIKIKEAFFLGLFCYSVFELTNYSIFKSWKFSTVLIDTVWGGVLFSIVIYLFRTIKNIL